jgi:hypothetical protein
MKDESTIKKIDSLSNTLVNLTNCLININQRFGNRIDKNIYDNFKITINKIVENINKNIE